MRFSCSFIPIFLWGFFPQLGTGIRSSFEFSHSKIENGMEFDYIVVGGGTAGCTVASRLSQNGSHSVLLIEAGRVPHANWTIPALSLSTLLAANTGDVKVYNSIPQENAARREGGVMSYTVGRTLGGGSSVNGMFFNRGNPQDYDNWADVTADTSWKYGNLLKYFKRLENYHGAYPFNSDQHGKGGPVTVSSPRYAPLAEEWREAGSYLGYSYKDPNGPQSVSFTKVDFTKRFGRRVSSFTAYIRPNLGHRPNLRLITDSTVNQIVFEDKTAVGVVFNQGNTTRHVRAKKEVILSAGVIGSAELLMKSGVGPENVLNSCNIQPIKYLPVGRNMHDHIGVRLEFFVNEKWRTFVPSRDLNERSLAFYERFGDGPYSYDNGHSQAFLTSSVAKSRTWPDLHVMFAANQFREEFNPERRANESIITITVVNTRPKSRGQVILNATDPWNSDPLIDPGYLSHPEDTLAIIDGIKMVMDLVENTPQFQKVGARYSTTPIQECRHFPFRSDEYWRCFVRFVSVSDLHGGGTCKMGREGDKEAVVDSQLRVIGLKSLRVADTSIMPQLTNSNTQAPAYVIGEKVSDFILGI